MPTDAPALPARRALAPRYWVGHLLVLVAVVACLLLGRWQLDVWHDHRSNSAAAVTREDPVPLDEVLGPDAAFPASGVGRPVVVEGRWDPARTVYVADRRQGGRTGVWAVTPVVTATGSAIPIVRGWTRTPADAPAAPSGAADLVGLLQPSEDTGLQDSDPRDDVLPELSITDLIPRASYDLYGGYVVATDRDLPSGAPASTGMAGLSAVTPAHLPGPDASSGLRNLLYALQWWVFGAFAVFMWWRWVQEEVLGRRSSPRPR
ncbi:MAG TPA: SURF1 family protein [Nocardioides sp.]|nr:SURF1 family protein [Nocardioides sp.]